MSAAATDTCSRTYTLRIPIDAPTDVVWRSLTEETNAWWLPDYHMVGADSVVSLEPRAGGQLLEQRADGGSLLWYTVVMALPGASLHLVGHVAPEWGGPATTMLSVKLEATDAGTLVIVQDALFGQLGEGTAASLEQGWAQLFGEGLKAFVEAA